MAFMTANGSDVLDARVSIPRVGAWHADLAVAAKGGLSGAVAFTINGVGFSGTARRQGESLDVSMARVVGGAGGLNLPTTPKQYRNVPLSSVLADILGAAGETLAAGSDSGLLGTYLPFWVVQAGPVGAALADLLADQDGAVWRVLLDGTVWVGFETWPASSQGGFDLLREDPVAGRVHIYAEVPTVVPGTLFQGQKVSYVEHSLTEEAFRTSLWMEDA